MPLRTPFRLLIGLFKISHNHLFRCVTFTQLTILHANIPFPHSLYNTLQIKPSHFETDSANSLLETVSSRELPVSVSCRELPVSGSCRELLVFGSCRGLPVTVSSHELNSVAPIVFKIIPLHRPHGKRVAPLLSVCLLSCCLAMVTARTTENQLRNSRSAISFALLAA
jgi:hypothetical protein